MLKKGDIVRSKLTGHDCEVTRDQEMGKECTNILLPGYNEPHYLYVEDFEKQPEIIWELLDENAKMPSYAEPSAAGFDIFTPVNVYIEPRGTAFVDAKIRADVPAGHYVKIFEKSGLALKQNLGVSAGVIDYGYTGSWGMILRNLGDTPINIPAGKAIAQGVLMEYKRAKISSGKVDKQTVRGSGGYGSTNQ